MESTAFNHASLQPVHSIGYHRATLHGIHCIQSCFIATTAFTGTIGPCCMESTAFKHAAWNPLHSIGMDFTTLHGLHCIQSPCMQSTAFTPDALHTAAWNPVHSITLHGIHCIQSLSILPSCMESASFNGLYAEWCNVSRLNEVDSMQLGVIDTDGMQWIPCIVIECSELHATW